MELPSNLLLIIFYFGLVVMMLLGAVWFVYLSKMHKFADKELKEAENSARKSMKLANEKIEKEIVQFESIADHGSIQFRNIFTKAIKDYETSLMHSIEQQFSAMQGLNKNIDQIAQNSAKRYSEGVDQILKDAEISISSYNDSVKKNIELIQNNYLKQISNFGEEIEKLMLQKMEERLKVYEERRIAMIDNDLRRKIQQTWKEVIGNSISTEDLSKSIKLGLSQFEKDFGGHKDE